MSETYSPEEFQKQFGGKAGVYHAPKGARPAGVVARGGRVKGAKKGMNKVEKAYAAHLDRLLAAGEVLWYGFELVTLKLAADTRWTADFAVLLKDGEVVLRDTKGWNRKRQEAVIEDATRIKLRTATNFPFRVEVVVWDGAEWKHEEVCPE